MAVKDLPCWVILIALGCSRTLMRWSILNHRMGKPLMWISAMPDFLNLMCLFAGSEIYSVLKP